MCEMQELWLLNKKGFVAWSLDTDKRGEKAESVCVCVFLKRGQCSFTNRYRFCAESFK